MFSLINPSFLSRYVTGYIGPRVWPILASSIVVSWYTTNLGTFTNTWAAYTFITNKALAIFSTFLMFLVLECFASLGRVLILNTLDYYGAMFLDALTRALVELFALFIPDWFYRILAIGRFNLLLTAFTYLLEDMIFINGAGDNGVEKDIYYLGNTNLLNTPTTWDVCGQNIMFCQLPTQQMFVRGNLGEFPMESVVGKINNSILAAMSFAPKGEISGAFFPPVVGNISNFFFTIYNNLYGWLPKSVKCGWLAKIKSCFYPGVVNFVLIYTGISPATAIYEYAIQNGTIAGQTAISSYLFRTEPNFMSEGTLIMHELGIGSKNTYPGWIIHVMRDIGLVTNQNIGKYLTVEQNFDALIDQQTIIYGILVQTTPKISFDVGSPTRQKLDQYTDALIQLEILMTEVNPNLLEALKKEVYNGIRARYEKVFTFKNLMQYRYTFSRLGFNLAYLNRYESVGENVYIGDTNMQDLFWAFTGNAILIDNMILRGGYLSCIPPVIQDIQQNRKLYAPEYGLKILENGLVLGNQLPL